MDDSDNESGSEAENEANSFLTRSEAAKKMGISVSKLRTLEAISRIPKPAVRAGFTVPVFPESVITDYIKDQGAGEESENPLSDLVRAAKDLLAQEQAHSAKMFDKHAAGFNDIYKLMNDIITGQQKQILDLEKQAFDMREAQDKVLNYEHERKLEELREQRKEAMQKTAITQVMAFAGPYLQKKLGIQIGPPVQSSGDNQEQLLGQAVIGMLMNMTDEKFIALKDIVGEEAYNVLEGIRKQVKQS